MIAIEQIPHRARPHKVDVAVKLLYASLAIEFLLSIADDFLTGELFSLGGLLALLFVYWLLWALITLIGKGHKKALITFFALNVIGLLAVGYVIIQDISLEGIVTLPSSWFTEMLSFSSMIMQLIALFLLLQRPSLDWFKVTQAGQAH